MHPRILAQKRPTLRWTEYRERLDTTGSGERNIRTISKETEEDVPCAARADTTDGRLWKHGETAGGKYNAMLWLVGAETSLRCLIRSIQYSWRPALGVKKTFYPLRTSSYNTINLSYTHQLLQ
jgi:hypothetical protein